MFGANPGHNLDRDDSYGYDDEKLEWFQRFDLRPVGPATIRERVDDGDVLRTLDLPRHLGRQLVVEPETGVALYRLVQLFGTPNVGVWTAGTAMPERDVTTWQYVFDATYAEPDGPDRELLLSIYDHKTEVSTGLSCWETPGDDDDARPIAPPNEVVPERLDLPDETFCEGIVQLVLNVVEEPVPATFKELWV